MLSLDYASSYWQFLLVNETSVIMTPGDCVISNIGTKIELLVFMPEENFVIWFKGQRLFTMLLRIIEPLRNIHQSFELNVWWRGELGSFKALPDLYYWGKIRYKNYGNKDFCGSHHTQCYEITEQPLIFISLVAECESCSGQREYKEMFFSYWLCRSHGLFKMACRSAFLEAWTSTSSFWYFKKNNLQAW